MQEHLRKIPGVPSRLIEWLPLEVPEPDLPLFEYEKEVIRRFYVRMPVASIRESTTSSPDLFRLLVFYLKKNRDYSTTPAWIEFGEDLLAGKLHLHPPVNLKALGLRQNDIQATFGINLRRPGPDGQYHR